MYKNIHTFNDIEILSQCTLVLDFDETIAKYDSISKQWWKDRFDYYYAKYPDYELADDLSLRDWKEHIHLVNPQHTDKDGILKLIDKAIDQKCRILCLTARCPELKEITIKHIKHLELQIDEIHFTKNIGKGHYLNSIINNGDNVIFVDDMDENLLDVLKNVTIAGSITCFKFICQI